MRFARMVGWSAAGAVPGVVLFVATGFVDGENLGLLSGAFLLAIIGAVIGGVAGWQKESRARWGVAGGAVAGAVVGASFGVWNNSVGPFPPITGVIVAPLTTFIGAAVGHRMARSRSIKA